MSRPAESTIESVREKILELGYVPTIKEFLAMGFRRWAVTESRLLLEKEGFLVKEAGKFQIAGSACGVDIPEPPKLLDHVFGEGADAEIRKRFPLDLPDAWIKVRPPKKVVNNWLANLKNVHNRGRLRDDVEDFLRG